MTTVYSRAVTTAVKLAAMEFDDDYGRPSKSAKKREAQSKNDLGKKLVDYPKAVLKKLSLSEDLRDAVEAAQAIKAYGGRRRQMQLISKILRIEDSTQLEEDIERLEMGLPIKDVEEKIDAPDPIQPWLDKFADQGDAVIADMLEEGLNVDRQQLRQLLRNFTKAPQAGSKAHTALSQYLRSIL